VGRGLLGAFLAVAIVAAVSVAGRAARDIQSVPSEAGSRELIVFETEGCIYCGLLRRDVLPDYLKSRRAVEVPIRFMDVNNAGSLQPALAGPLTVVPTVVLISNGRETGRITGYTGPEIFFHMINHLLAKD
jgi:thioredoxin-related protein